MRRLLLAAAVSVATMVACAPSQAMNCVAYTRSVTGMELSGDAWQWWYSAAGEYARGHKPQRGAVIVFSRTRGMVHGHVGVVRDVLSAREILIDQANWQKARHRGGIVTKAVSVVDVSPANDWSQVRVEWGRGGVYGRVNPISGFIYPVMERIAYAR